MKKQDFKVLKTKDLYPFPDNPFHVAEDETLSELAESIKEFGIVTPIITRPKEDGDGYEVIAGQRRVRASELAGINTVQRFIRLTELIPPILQMVDEGKIALTPAVELSFLKKDEQENLFATMESEEATPSLSQAQRMKQLSQSGRLDMDTIFAIMTEEKGNQKETLKINTSKLKKYFPKNTTPKQMEETIIKLLERELQRKRNRDSR
ncbi:ParB/RepB/Spo0J family partition protein [Streptococcus hyovaginalis]